MPNIGSRFSPVDLFCIESSTSLTFIEDLKGVNITFRVAKMMFEGVALNEYCLSCS